MRGHRIILLDLNKFSRVVNVDVLNLPPGSDLLKEIELDITDDVPGLRLAIIDQGASVSVDGYHYPDGEPKCIFSVTARL